MKFQGYRATVIYLSVFTERENVKSRSFALACTEYAQRITYEYSLIESKMSRTITYVILKHVNKEERVMKKQSTV